jgi:phage tail sheath gpL-like
MTFDATIPTPIYKPGAYFGFNTTLAARSLATNDQKLLIIGQRLTSGTIEPLTPVDVFSEDEAALYFGSGSQVHRMARAAIKANPYIQLTVLALDDESGATAASGTLALGGTASTSGQVALTIAGESVTVAVTAGDTPQTILSGLVSAADAASGLPVKAALTEIKGEEEGDPSTWKLTLTALNAGVCGNEIGLSVNVTASGITPTLTAMSKGAINPPLEDAFSAVYAAGHTLIILPYSIDSAVNQLGEHLDSVSGPLEQRGAVGVIGWNSTLSTGTTLTGKANRARMTCGWHPGSALPNGELAAIYAAIIASESDPARPLNTLELPGLDITAQSNWPGRTEQENALMNGLSPFEVDGSVVRIVRAVTTYVRNASGVTDRSLMDITIIRALDYVRLACRTRYTQRFPREKLTDMRLQRIRSELLDVLYALETLEIVENVDALKDQLTVARSLQDDSRAEAKIPAAVVRGLHVFAGTIYLM